jgi:hypothetical protein
MKRSGQQAGFNGPAATLRIEKNQLVEKFDFVLRADAAIEVVEIGAAAQGDVLAIIDVLTAGQDVRSGAPTEKWFLFE